MQLAEAEDQLAPVLMTLRMPRWLADAADRAAAKDLSSRSDVGRKALVQYLKSRSLLTNEVA
jgi:metal-responsive CopG/Arc/MetJ family transcriptional regulator